MFVRFRLIKTLVFQIVLWSLISGGIGVPIRLIDNLWKLLDFDSVMLAIICTQTMLGNFLVLC